MEESDENSNMMNSEDAFRVNFCAKTILNPRNDVNNGHCVELIRYDFNAFGEISIYEFAYKLALNYMDNPQRMSIHKFQTMPDNSNGETWETHSI